ncbi:MAG TPA: hypothetical protein VI423_08710, partial [Paenisporosarcina sp.]|nr:hypothetical protein [Paenisporosarcina sp.]
EIQKSYNFYPGCTTLHQIHGREGGLIKQSRSFVNELAGRGKVLKLSASLILSKMQWYRNILYEIPGIKWI